MNVSRGRLVGDPAREAARDGAARPIGHLIAQLAAVAASYWLAARLGLLIPYVGTHVSLVWLPTGIALAAFRRWGAAMAPAVFVAAAFTNASLGGPAWVAVAVGVGNTAGPWLAAALLARWGVDDRLLRRRDLAALLAAVLAGMLVTSTNGVAWMRAAGFPDVDRLGVAWSTWLLGDSVGALLAAIPLIALTRTGARQAFLGRAGLANSALAAGVLACALLVFSPWLAAGSPLLFPLLALTFFLVALLALRGGVVASSTGVLLLSMAAAYGTARGRGPFAQHDAHAGVLALWSYVTAQACTSLLICGIGTELQTSRRQFAALMRHAHDGILILDEDEVLLLANDAATALLGLGDERVDGWPLAAIPRGNGVLLAGLAEDAAGASRELALAGADGGERHVECQRARTLDASGHWQTTLILRDITARRLAEARLATSESRLKALTDNLQALFAYVDRDQVYRFANAHFRRLMGTEPEQLIGKTMREFLGADAHAAVLPHIEGALRGERQKFERTGWNRNAHIHFLVEYVPERGDDGEVVGFFIMVLDISDRRQAEIALARSEDRIRTLTDNMPGLISQFDRDYRYTFANAQYQSWFGLAESPVGKTVADVFGQAIFEGVRARMDEAMAGGEVVFELVNAIEGAPDRLLVHYLPDRDADGQVVGVYGLVMDRTEQHLANERLEASERQLRSVTDNLPVLITYVDADERLRFMNRTFHDWLGVDLKTALGRPLVDVIGREHYDARRDKVRAALGGQRVDFEMQSRTIDGQLRNLQTVYLPDVREDGVVRGIFTLSTDVTALKTVEARLQQLARLDPLTGLANRRHFDELLEQAIARSNRAGRPMALIYLDVDHFKAINDSRGHGAGDQVLKEFARRLQATMRETDAVARLAGDEFVVISEGVDTVDEALLIASKLLEAVRAPMAVGEDALNVTTSMGIAFRRSGTEGFSAKELVACADRALYRAKTNGRDGWFLDS